MSAKLFEVGDILPQGLVKITGKFYSGGEIFIYLSSDYTNLFMSKSDDVLDFAFGNSFDSFLVEDNTDYSSRTINAIFDFSSLSESERTFNSGYYDGSNKVYWEEYIAGYSVTYEENGGSTVTDLTEQTNLPSPLPTTTKSNLVFGGWFYESNFTTKALANDTLTSDVTLYAKWLDTSALLLKLNAIRNALKTSINAKGGTLTTETLDQYASAVDGIQIAVELTQAQYDALSVYDNNTYYLIVEDE